MSRVDISIDEGPKRLGFRVIMQGHLPTGEMVHIPEPTHIAEDLEHALACCANAITHVHELHEQNPEYRGFPLLLIEMEVQRWVF